jgi:succinate dehydrogenase/fumarate reductase cytochrome b subunit
MIEAHKGSGDGGCRSPGILNTTPGRQNLIPDWLYRSSVSKSPREPSWAFFDTFTCSLAPSFMAAACYMAFGRLVYWVTPESYRSMRYLWVPVRWITTIFVTFDIISFLIQFLGLASLAASVTSEDSDATLLDKVEKSLRIVKLGLIVQLLCFVIFTVVGVRMLSVNKRWRDQWPDTGRWKQLNWAINCACALLVVSPQPLHVGELDHLIVFRSAPFSEYSNLVVKAIVIFKPTKPRSGSLMPSQCLVTSSASPPPQCFCYVGAHNRCQLSL